MKKLICIMVLGLLFSGNAYAKTITIEKCYENSHKVEHQQTTKSKTQDVSIREYGANDKFWSEKSYKDYMNNIIISSNKNEKTFDPFESQYSKPKLKRKDKFKITVNTKTGILSFVTLSSPAIKKNNKKIVDYTDGVVFAKRDDWDRNDGYGNGSLGYEDLQVNLIKNTMYIYKYSSRYQSNGYGTNEISIQNFLCQSNDQSDGDIAGGEASGTAFFISKKGYLLTNNHVVKGCNLSKISYFNKEYDAKLIATDKTLDLALLKVKAKPKSYFSFSKDDPKKLQKIYVAGYPLGKGLSDDLKITTGIISALKGFKDNSNEIQVDAAINRGNSGGPIVNENGELVAIAVSGLSKKSTESINFGIKANAAKNFLKLNKVSPSMSKFNFSSNSDKLLKILEESTVYTYCNK